MGSLYFNGWSLYIILFPLIGKYFGLSSLFSWFLGTKAPLDISRVVTKKLRNKCKKFEAFQISHTCLTSPDLSLNWPTCSWLCLTWWLDPMCSWLDMKCIWHIPLLTWHVPECSLLDLTCSWLNMMWPWLDLTCSWRDFYLTWHIPDTFLTWPDTFLSWPDMFLILPDLFLTLPYTSWLDLTCSSLELTCSLLDLTCSLFDLT